MEIADNARLRKSIKISLEHKFIKQKAEFLDSVEKQMQAMQQNMASQIQENHQQLINANIRVSLLERKNEEKQRIIAEQELLLRNYATTLTSVATQSSVVEEQLDSQEYKKQIEDLKMKNLRLSLKLAKVLGYFVEFKLYNNEYAQRVEKDECPCEEIRKPKLHQHQDLLDQLTNNEKFYQALAKQHV